MTQFLFIVFVFVLLFISFNDGMIISRRRKVRRIMSPLCSTNIDHLKDDKIPRMLASPTEACANGLPVSPMKMTRLSKDNFVGSGHNYGLIWMKFLYPKFVDKLADRKLLIQSITDEDIEDIKLFQRTVFYTKTNFPMTYQKSLENNFDISKEDLASFFNEALSQHLPYIKDDSKIVYIIGFILLSGIILTTGVNLLYRLILK